MSLPTVPDRAGSTIGENASRAKGTQRIMTGVIAVPIALSIVFFAPAPLVLVAAILAFGGAAVEYVRLVRRWAPSAPLGVIPLASATSAAGLYALLAAPPMADATGAGVMWLLLGLGVLIAVSGLMVLFSAARMPEAMIATGLIHFGIPYFALPMISFYVLAARDPWLLALLLFAVWVGDTFAYGFGKRFGRHTLAPIVSPNKTWEGSIAGLLGSLAVAAIWCLLRLGEIDPWLVAVTGLASAAGQLGDLLESMVKRGVGVKDSSGLLPGHGGLFDRLDAVIVAAPVFVIGLWLLGHDLFAGTPPL